MIARCKAICAVDGLLGALDCVILELDHRPALDADQVVVVFVPICVLEMPGAHIGTGLAGQASLGQELNCPENGSLADARVYAPRLLQELLVWHLRFPDCYF